MNTLALKREKADKHNQKKQFKAKLKIITCKYKDFFQIDIKNTNFIYKILRKEYFDNSALID